MPPKRTSPPPAPSEPANRECSDFRANMGYFLLALPAGVIAGRFGYEGGLVVGLRLAAAGAFWFIPAVSINAYWGYLPGLFVLANGLACLETIATPYGAIRQRLENKGRETCSNFVYQISN